MATRRLSCIDASFPKDSHASVYPDTLLAHSLNLREKAETANRDLPSKITSSSISLGKDLNA